MFPASLLLLKRYAEKKKGGERQWSHISCILSCIIFPSVFKSLEVGVHKTQHHLLGKGGDYPTRVCTGATSI